MKAFRHIARLGLAVATAAALALAFGTGSASAQKRGGELHTVVSPEPAHLGLGMTGQIGTYVISSKIFQSLYKYDFDLQPIPVLATDWEASADGKAYTIKLREDVRWHDGKPFTAHDVAFTCNEILRKYNPLSRRVFAEAERIYAKDDHTVVFEFKTPYPAFMSMFDVASVPILPKHLYEGTDYPKNEWNQKPIGTGPFKFAEWKKGGYVKLVRNDDYWKPGLPYLDAIWVHILPDAASRALALEEGRIHFTSWSWIEGYDIPRLEALPHLEMTTKGYELMGTMMWLEFNHRKAPFNDVRFRKALAHAIDRNFIRDNIYYGLGKLPGGPISTGTRYYDADVQANWDYNPAKARQMLDDMGLKPDADGVRLTVDFIPIYASLGEQHTRVGEYIQQALEDVGIKANIINTDAGGWMKKMGNWEYDIAVNFMGQYGDPELGVARSYITGNIKKGVPFNNMAGYSNPAVDDLFARGAVEMDPAQRAAIYSELQETLIDDMAFVWLLEFELPHFVNTKFKNVITNALGNKDDFEGVYMAE